MFCPQPQICPQLVKKNKTSLSKVALTRKEGTSAEKVAMDDTVDLTKSSDEEMGGGGEEAPSGSRRDGLASVKAAKRQKLVELDPNVLRARHIVNARARARAVRQTRGEAAGMHGNRAHKPHAHRYSAPSTTAEDEDPMPLPPCLRRTWRNKPPPPLFQACGACPRHHRCVCCLFLFSLPFSCFLPPTLLSTTARVVACGWQFHACTGLKASLNPKP